VTAIEIFLVKDVFEIDRNRNRRYAGEGLSIRGLYGDHLQFSGHFINVRHFANGQ